MRRRVCVAGTSPWVAVAPWPAAVCVDRVDGCLKPPRHSISKSLQCAMTRLLVEAGRASGFVNQQARAIELVSPGMESAFEGKGVGKS